MPATPEPMSIYHPDAVTPRPRPDAFPRAAPRPLPLPEPEPGPAHDPLAKGVLKPQSRAGRIRDFLREHGQATRGEIAAALGLEARQASKSLDNMRQQGHVERGEPSVYWRLTERHRGEQGAVPGRRNPNTRSRGALLPRVTRQHTSTGGITP